MATEVEPRWMLSEREYLDVVKQVRKNGFNRIDHGDKKLGYLEDIYYDKVKGEYYFLNIHDSLLRARLYRQGKNKKIYSPERIVATFKRRIMTDPSGSIWKEFPQEIPSIDEFHIKERDIFERGYSPVLAFIRRRHSYCKTIDYNGRRFDITTEQDKIIAYEIQRKVGLDYKDTEEQKRFGRRFSLEIIADAGDEEPAKEVLGKMAKELGLTDKQKEKWTYFDLILLDAVRTNLIESRLVL